MRALLFIYLIVMSAGLVDAQNKPYNTFNKEAELQKFVEQGGKAEEISPNIYQLKYRTRENRIFNFNQKENKYKNNEDVETTIINMWEIDTTKFSGMFTFWQQVQVANSLWAPLPIEDLNNNGQPELYGYTNTIVPNFETNIYERNVSGIYQNVFTYDSQAVFVKGIGDIKGTESKEIVIYYFENNDSVIYHYPIYKSDSLGALPTTLDFIFYFDGYQINDMTFGDFNKNEITDCAFTVAHAYIPPMSIIAEFKDSINNFKEIFRFSSLLEDGLSGFATNDFNHNGKTDLVFSSGAGNVFVIENKAENEYSIVNQFPFPTYNAYMQTATNDIDDNGKPEFWIGGQDFEQGITIYQCYEAIGINSYETVARIELRYATSFGANYIQAIDIDNDGKEELVISVGNSILILKFVGSPNNHQYKLWYAKFGEATQPGAQFDIVAISDLDNDGKKDLLIPMERYTPSIYYAFSYILKQNDPSDVVTIDNYIPSQDFIQSYPVPFNLTSSIRFAISKENFVMIRVYNSLGKEIQTLLEEKLSPGEYNIHWEARDKYNSPLPSGIYFISLQSDNVTKTTKTILLK